MARLGALALLFLLAVLARMMTGGPSTHCDGADATMVLGFVLVVSFMAGRLAARIGVPSITGYILTGVLFGPQVMTSISPWLSILTRETVIDLQLLDGAALGLIALTAGGELRLSFVKRHRRSLVLVIGCQIVGVVLGVGTVTYLIRGAVPGLAELSAVQAIAAALLLGVTAVAKSPATTIAIIQEYHPRGPMSEVVLAVTVAKDIVVVALFTAAMALAVRLAGQTVPGVDPPGAVVVELAWELLGSLVLGVVVGWLFRLYGRYVGVELPFVVLAIAFLSGALVEEVRLSGLLVCMVAGFYVENFSKQGQALIDAVERHSLPLYVLFFTIAGASLDFVTLRQTWPLALMLVASRLLFTFVATFVGARWAGAPRSVQLHAWSGFVGQAGVTLGFAAMIAQRLPGIGSLLSTIVVAAVAVNQLIGPIVFRFGLLWAGEIRKRRVTRRTARPANPSRPLQRLKSWTDPSIEEGE